MHCSPPLWHSCNHFTVAMVYIIWQYLKSTDTKVLLFFFLLLFFLFLFLLFLQSTPEIGRSWVPWGRLPCLSTAWSRVVFAVLSAVFILRQRGPMEWRCPVSVKWKLRSCVTPRYPAFAAYVVFGESKSNLRSISQKWTSKTLTLST